MVLSLSLLYLTLMYVLDGCKCHFSSLLNFKQKSHLVGSQNLQNFVRTSFQYVPWWLGWGKGWSCPPPPTLCYVIGLQCPRISLSKSSYGFIFAYRTWIKYCFSPKKWSILVCLVAKLWSGRVLTSSRSESSN